VGLGEAPDHGGERGLDFADAELAFAGTHFTRAVDRNDFGENRASTAGFLRERFGVVAWTPREGWRRIISMRYGHDREEARFESYLD
jgi:uncharacterized DUF497 family protein